MQPKMKQYQDSILFSHHTPTIKDTNQKFQNDFSDIIEEQTIPDIPNESNLLSKLRQTQIRNNSPEQKDTFHEIECFKQSQFKINSSKAPLQLFLDNECGTQLDLQRINKELNLTPTNITLNNEQDKDKSQFGISMISEEQPFYNNQNISQQVQNRIQTNVSQVQSENKCLQNKISPGKRSSNKENNSPFFNQLHQSIQFSAQNDIQQMNLSNNQSNNLINNRFSNPKSQQGADIETVPQGRVAKYSKLLKQFVQKKKFRAQNKRNSNTSLNGDQNFNHQSSILKLKQKIQSIVTRAAKKWKEYSSSWVYSQLGENAYKIIGDKAHITPHQLFTSENLGSSSISKKNNIIQQQLMVLYKLNKIKMKSCFYQVIKKWKQIKTIDPSSTILLYWDIIHILFIIFNIYYLILEWVTDVNFTSLYGKPWIISIISSFVIFGIDIILNFHKGFYHEGVCIYDKMKISKFYLAKNFFFDLCAIIPLVISLSEMRGQSKVLTVLIIFKLQTAIYILSKYKDLYQSRSSSSYTSPIIYLIKLALTILFVAHVFASFFLGLAIYIQKSDTGYSTWLMQRQIVHEPWLIQYTFSLYWAVCTMTTVGYGDITPQNPYEAGYVIITMFIACGFFGYTFNSIGSMVQEIQNKNREFNDQMKVVNLFLQNNDISNDLKLRIRKYFEFKRNSRKDITKKEESEILEQLDDDLKDLVVSEVGIQKYKKIKEITNLFDPFSDKIKKKLHEISEEIVIRGDDYKYYIVQANQIQEYYDLFILISGKAKIYMKSNQEEINDASICGNNDMFRSELIFNEKKEKNNKQNQIQPLYILENKSIFGEQSFFTNQQRQFSIKCDKNSRLIRISQKLFLELIKENQSDYELFCQIRDNITLNQNFQTIGSQCLACNKTGHDITKCKYIHYQIDKSQFVHKKHLQEKYEAQENQSKQTYFERKKQMKQKYTKFMKYNTSLTNQNQPTTGVQTPQTKKNATLKQTSFRTLSNLTIIIPNNPEDKPDSREQVNLSESDSIYEFKFYYPESNISCIIWRMVLQNLKRRKNMDQFLQQSEVSQALTHKTNMKSNNSLFNNLLSKPKNNFLKLVLNQNNNKLNTIQEIVASMKNSPRMIDKSKNNPTSLNKNQ